ncbi:MAG TPA: hypothetical protein VF060_09760 [Trebonia sp.]
MSLDAWEEHALKSIADDLTASAPELASRLVVFNRLTSGERMPGDQRAKMGKKRRGHRRAWPRRGSWRGQAGEAGPADGVGRAGWTRGPVMRPRGKALPVVPVIAILAVVTAIMIAVAVVLSGSGHSPAGTGASHCLQAWPITCPRR